MERSESSKRYIFGPYTLETSSVMLLRGSKPIPLTKKRYEILLLLVENAGQVMEKEAIIERVWPDQFVEEANLANNIHALRRLIELDPRHPKLIVTVPGRGYKFQEEVLVSTDSPDAETAARIDKWAAFERRRKTIYVGITLALVAAGFTGWLISRAISAREKAVNSFPQPLTAYPGVERSPALTADGKLIAFSWDGDQLGNEDIYVRQTIESELVRITTDPRADRLPRWSPDGHYIAFLRADEEAGGPQHLMVIPALGGTEREIAEVDEGLDWSMDGQYLATSGLNEAGGGMGIFLLGINNNIRKRLTTPPPNGGIFDSTPRFSPDGRSLAFLRYTSDSGCDIVAIELATGKMRQVTKERKAIASQSLQWSADSQKLYFISSDGGTIQVWQIGVESGATEVVPNLPTPITAFSIARDANLLAFVNEQDDTRIEIYEKGAEWKRSCVINSTRTDHGGIWSPDGSQLIFSSNRTGWDELWVARMDCSQIRQLTSFREFGVGSPQWSPDGQRIAFDRRNNKESDIYTIGIDGSSLRKVTDSVGGNTMPYWSPDGQWIYFNSNRAIPHSIYQIWKIPAEGGTAVPVTNVGNNGARNAAITRDGKTIYYNHNDRLWRTDLQSGQASLVNETANLYAQRNWCVGARGIFFHEAQKSPGLQIDRLDLLTGKVSILASSDIRIATASQSLSITDDEQRFAVTTISNNLSDIMLIRNWR